MSLNPSATHALTTSTPTRLVVLQPRFSTTVIYGLFDPRDGELRYIGKSETGLKERVREHYMPSYLATPSHKNSWIRGLLAEGLKPVGVALQTLSVSPEELCAAERYWIAFFRAAGVRLTNMTDGGEGLPGIKPTPETREKMRLAHLGKKQSPETIAKRAASRMGMRPTEETRAKLRAAAKKRGVSAATRAALLNANLGSKHSAERRRAQSERVKRWWTDENNRSRMKAARNQGAAHGE